MYARPRRLVTLLASLLSVSLSLLSAGEVTAAVKLIAPAGYLPGRPFLVRVESRHASGHRDWTQWNGEAILSVDQPGVTLSTSRVELRNGLGTVLLTASGTTDFTLRATINDESSARAIRVRTDENPTSISGILPGTNSIWSGVISITADVTVPAGHKLTINPGTIVLVNGVASGTSGIRITVNGSVRSLGTEVAPVTITCADPALNWGQIRHESAEPSLYQYTFISRAGRVPGEGHTGSGPAIRASNAQLTFENSAISDLTADGISVGKIMMASGSALSFRDCVFTRARMGPEIESTGLSCVNSYFTEMRGPDDADGIYLHDAGDRPLLLSGCVLAGGDDDAIDTLDSTVTIENCIIRDWPNPNEDAKGVSAFNGEVILRRCLISSCYVGLSTKSSGPLGVLRIDHCTINGITRGVSAATKSNATAGNLNIYLTNSIVRATDALHSDFGADRFVSVSYSNLGEVWPGAGNQTSDPLWVNPAAGDFRLQPASPCIDAGDPASRPDPDLSRADIGFYTAQSTSQSGIVISEIMYHPESENPLDEYIELHNRGATPVSLTGWRFTAGVNFTFPNISIPAGGHLVVAADLPTFRAKFPGVSNVVGNWSGTLSNSRENIDLEDALGALIDSVRYADEGHWAIRQRGDLHYGRRGWKWFSEHDGLGKSLELINAQVSNDNGQNWGASLVLKGTPGRGNSIAANHTAPLIESVAHSPLVPKSTDNVVINARVGGFPAHNATATLFHRIDGASVPLFNAVPMRDDGQGGDASGGDGIFTAILPPHTNNTVVEYYIRVVDSFGLERYWPAPAIPAPDGFGPSGQVANALYQVDDSEYAGTQPIYKIVMTEAERAELEAIGNNAGGSSLSDAQMNATFISLDGTGTDLRYIVGVRNRGHGTRTAEPNNFRVNFRSDQTWKGVVGLNLNAQYSWLQVLGAAIHTRAGSVGAYSRAVQLRVNNANLAFSGGIERTYGSYAANEVIDADWADRHFPNDSNGNIYRAIRDIVPFEFDYRTLEAYSSLYGPENKDSYTNTWFKSSNVSEDDWRDLIAMLNVMGPNGTIPFTPQEVRRVINADQWLNHLALMNLLGNSETGLNSGLNDDYFMYRGITDSRFVLMYYDLDQILGVNRAFSPTSTIFSAESNLGAGRAIGRLLRHPEFEPLYYEQLRSLIETTLSAGEFDALVDQVLGDFVPLSTRTQIKTWMEQRRTYVLSQLPIDPPAQAPVATVTGTPRSPTPRSTAAFVVGGEGVTHYRYSLNGAAFSSETPAQNPITLSNLPNGTNNLAVIARNASGVYQLEPRATKISWVVNTALPAIRLNEVMASRSAGAPDQVELFNEGTSTIDLAGFRLTDDPSQPGKFTFASVTLPAGAYLVLDANQLSFSLDAGGEAVYLFDKNVSGGALLDYVVFGRQLTDLSIGRMAQSGAWSLTQPSFGTVNTLQPLANANRTRINEWLTFGVSPTPDDFVELYNPESLPVAIGGGYLTDQRSGAPTQSPIAPLSFVAPRGFIVFTAGNGNSPDEINFSLSSEQGEIALLDNRLSVIDSVIYGPQRAGISMGRCPDGAADQKPLLAPTPGSPNQCPAEPTEPQAVTLVSFNHVWRYDRSGSDPGPTWKESAYNDSSWSSGEGLIGFGDAQNIPEPIRTGFSNPRVTTYYFRTTFELNPALAPSGVEITHVIDDGAAFYLNGEEIGFRFNLAADATASSYSSRTVTDADYESFTIPPNLLLPGTNVLAVEVHQANSSSSDMIFGLRLQALVVTNSAADAGVMINEVVANNSTLAEPNGTTPDWVELFNPSTVPVDLAGLSLTDSSLTPARWVFPVGSLLPARGFFRVICDPNSPVSATNTGFGLSANGGSLFLFNRPADGGGVQSSVSYGLQPADWSIGRTPDGGANWVLTIPSAGIANNAATLGNPQLLKINEWMADPISGADWFEVYNPNPEPVDISGMKLSDNLLQPDTHTLPPLSFIGNSANAYQRFDADELVASGADHVDFKLSASGESVGIFANNGVLIDGVSFGPQATGVSVGRLLDGSTNLTTFATTASPGSGNYLPMANVVVNEVLTHSDPPFMDAVELFNPTTLPVDISGYYLSDSALNLRKYQIPANSIVPAGGYLVIYEQRFNSDDASDPFSLSSTRGDEIFLSQSANGTFTGYRASAAFGPAENGVSIGRISTSRGFHFVPLESRTFGRDNPATTNEFVTGTGAANSGPRISPIIINEVMYHPAGTNEALEFVELHNRSASAQALFDPLHPTNTWRVRKGIEFNFPAGVTIPPGGYVVLANFNPTLDTTARAAFDSVYGPQTMLFGPYQGKLDNSGESIELLKPDAPQTGPGPDAGLVPYVMVDTLAYGILAPWPSTANGGGHSLQRINLGLYGNDPVNWTAGSPHPGTAGSSPTDTDGDGMPNDWETTNGLNPASSADALLDADLDGISNLGEYIAGTNPRNNADALRLTATHTGVRSVLEFQAVAGRRYSLYYCDQTPLGQWQLLTGPNTANTSGAVQVTDPNVIGSVRFYRLMVQP